MLTWPRGPWRERKSLSTKVQLLISLMARSFPYPLYIGIRCKPGRRKAADQLWSRLPQKGRVEMFTAEQYRAKAAEFNAFLANSPRSPNETSEFRNLAQTYTTLAENEEWMAVHLDRTVQRRKHGDDGAALAEVEEQVLRCLGAAVIMRWKTVPTKLQKELFDCASSIGNLQSPTSF